VHAEPLEASWRKTNVRPHATFVWRSSSESWRRVSSSASSCISSV